MAKLQNKNIILGICASISAYKSPNLVRMFKKDSYDVQCIMTNSSKEFVTEAALSNVSKNKVITNLFDKEYSADGAWHIKLAHSIDLCLIAPCSATTIGKLANGICDNALTTLVIALPKYVPVVIAPAMDYTMWEHPAVQENISKLKSFGYHIIEPEHGELSSGLVGKGRLPEESKIVAFVNSILEKSPNIPTKKVINNEDELLNEYKNNKLRNEIDVESEFIELKRSQSKLQGKKCLITLGSTIEKIDDVRFISNHSSGKMGLALAEEAISRGVDLTIVYGSHSVELPTEAKLIKVQSADEMYSAVMNNKDYQDLFIMTAAVADYKVDNAIDGKIKKGENSNELNLKLVQNKDILKSIGQNKSQNQYVVGFALESENGESNAKNKLLSKKADMIVLNNLNSDNQVFNNDFNKISIITSKYEKDFPKMSKKACAIAIFDEIEKGVG
jgi:phosphopantothenoylcysteine decarboxylase / phosphopantothenate---cysteine ligase